MTHPLRVVLVVLAIALSGCAATVQRQVGSDTTLALPGPATEKLVVVLQGSSAAANSADWASFVGEWRKSMSASTKGAGMTLDFQEGPTTPGPEPATLVVVRINDYRYVSAGARYGLGIMTGNAYIDADASFFELPSKKPVGTRKYNTTSSAWEGIFSAMTDKQVLGISREIVREVRGR